MIEQPTIQSRPRPSSPMRCPSLQMQMRGDIKTQGEMEAAVCRRFAHFSQESVGSGPNEIRAHLVGDLLVVRLAGVLTPTEKHLVQCRSAEKGRDLIKQVRNFFIETARPNLEEIIHEAIGVKVLSLHYDISTITGEEIFVAILAESPCCRKTKLTRN
jgi:uncharacterized protein YbcI